MVSCLYEQNTFHTFVVVRLALTVGKTLDFHHWQIGFSAKCKSPYRTMCAHVHIAITSMVFSHDDTLVLDSDDEWKAWGVLPYHLCTHC